MKIPEEHMYKLTENGIKTCEWFIKECQAKRKEVLDAGIDTADETHIPTIEDIESDLNEFVDEDGQYYNCWGVTDNYSSETICLEINKDFVEV